MTDATGPAPGSSENEFIKDASQHLRGTIAQGLRDPMTGGLSASDQQLVKFHGMYQQDDRDLRVERFRQKLEPLYTFMVRVRLPGGVCTSKQYLELDRLAREYGGGSLRLTTRQTFQFHGIAKRNLRHTIQALDKSLMDTIAACGDVNRNVMCNPNPMQSHLHAEVFAWANRLSEHLLPKTRAYHEIWLGDALVAGRADGQEDSASQEPLYGKHYLPRKFKIAVAVPPHNDVDVYANDLGFVAIAESDRLVGFDVTVGGGMGMSHGDRSTYPRLADVRGFCSPEQTLAVAQAVLIAQRDLGDRKSRTHARLKYTIDRVGLEAFQGEVERRLGFALAPARPFAFESNGDRYGWVKGVDDSWHYTLFIMSGRIRDEAGRPLLSALREIAQTHDGDFRMTGNQNLIIANVSERQKPTIDALLEKYGLNSSERLTSLRRGAMACVALPTCSQAMAEAERQLPTVLERLEVILHEMGLSQEPMVMRMTGCPNGCARPYLAEIALVGKNLGHYNLYLGGGFAGQRLGKLYRESLTEDEIVSHLRPMFQRWADERRPGEHFGDFVIRAGYVAATRQGKDFHD